MASVSDYLKLITSAWQGKPKFTAVITADTSVQVQVLNLLASMIALFDLDVAAGNQLDIIGQWVGISREVAIPSAGVYFTWDGTDYTLGWDYGSWAPPTTPVTITSLPDDAYRTLIRAKIAANRWDGTTTGAYAIWDAIFPTFKILIIDHQDMSYDLAIVGGIVDSLTLALLTGGYLPLKPEGIRINEYLVSVDSNPAFAWDVPTTDLMAGWDTGSWLREISP